MITPRLVRSLLHLRPNPWLALETALRIALLQLLPILRQRPLDLIIIRIIRVRKVVGQVRIVQSLVFETSRAKDVVGFE